MSWIQYRVIFRALSPVHIGSHKLGYIERTRYYIPGKNIWAAFTENITRTGAATDTNAYKAIGDALKKNLLISYFFPATEKDIANPLLPRYTPLLPHYTPEDGLKYGSYTAAQFEKIFITSYGQTAILPHSNTAEDNSLHESECIQHIVTIKEENLPVYFVGYIFIRENAMLSEQKLGWDDGDISIKNICSEIFIGGDRRYGWGHLQLESGKISDNTLFLLPVTTVGVPVTVKIPANNSLPAHCLFSDSDTIFKGDIQPLVGEEYDFNNNKGYGQNITKGIVHWVPGTIVTKPETAFSMNHWGILSPLKKQQ